MSYCSEFQDEDLDGEEEEERLQHLTLKESSKKAGGLLLTQKSNDNEASVQKSHLEIAEEPL